MLRTLAALSLLALVGCSKAETPEDMGKRMAAEWKESVEAMQGELAASAQAEDRFSRGRRPGRHQGTVSRRGGEHHAGTHAQEHEGYGADIA